jgi:hypothetical protein
MGWKQAGQLATTTMHASKRDLITQVRATEQIVRVRLSRLIPAWVVCGGQDQEKIQAH